MKGKIIEIYDGLLPSLTQNYIEDYITNKNYLDGGFPLYYNNNLTDERNNDPKSIDIGFCNNFFFKDNLMTKDLTLFLSPLYSLSSSQNLVVNDLILGRVFLQPPTPNYGPQAPHRDIEMPHYVCLYYVNDSDGDTIFYDDDQKTEIKRIPPKKGRIAFFDGSIYHCGSKPKNSTRIVINVGFQGTFLK